VPGCLLEVKDLSGRKAEKIHSHLLADCLHKCGDLDVSRPYAPPRPVDGMALPVQRSYFSLTFLHSEKHTAS
jgi:hypothetical protein